MTGWHERPMLAFDTETTGVDPHSARIVQAGLALIGAPGTAGAQQHLWLLDPGCPIPDAAAAVHGITTARVQEDGEDPSTVLEQIADAIVSQLGHGHPLIAYNAAYDCTLLEAELARHDLPTITERLGAFAPVIDPLVLDKHLDPYRKGSRKLEVAVQHYAVRLDGAHDAGHDALAAARVAWRIAQRHPNIATMPLDELHQLQVDAARKQADSLRAYFDSKGTEHDGVDGTWPVRRAPVSA